MKKDLSNSVSTLLNAFSDFVKSGTTALKNYNATVEAEKKQFLERQQKLQFQQFADYTERQLRTHIAETLNTLGHFPHIASAAIQVKVTELCPNNTFLAVAKISYTDVAYKAALYYDFDNKFLNCAKNIREDMIQRLAESLSQDADIIRQKQLDESNRIYSQYFANDNDKKMADNEFQQAVAPVYNARFATYKSLYISLSPSLYVVNSITHHKKDDFMELHLNLHFDDAGLSPNNYLSNINRNYR